MSRNTFKDAIVGRIDYYLSYRMGMFIVGGSCRVFIWQSILDILCLCFLNKRDVSDPAREQLRQMAISLSLIKYTHFLICIPSRYSLFSEQIYIYIYIYSFWNTFVYFFFLIPLVCILYIYIYIYIYIKVKFVCTNAFILFVFLHCIQW